MEVPELGKMDNLTGTWKIYKVTQATPAKEAETHFTWNP